MSRKRTTAADVRRILEKGKLSGWELGRLVLQDNVEVDHQRPGILSPADIKAVQKRVDSLNIKEAADFSKLQNLYRIVTYTIQEGKIQGLEALDMLHSAISLLRRFQVEDAIRKVMMFALPAIVTEKQLADLKAAERAFKLAELKKLRHVLENIVHELSPDEAVKRWNEPEEGETNFLYLTDFLADSLRPEDRAIVKEAAERLIQLIREGKIQPVLLPDKAIKKLKKLEQQRDDREADEETGDAPPEEYATVRARLEKKDLFIRQAYAEGQAQMTKARLSSIISILERIADGSFLQGWGDEEDDLLEYAYCTGEEEYRAQVGRWMEFVDTYHGDYEPGSSARADGYVQSLAGVAVLLDPQSHQVDDKGHFIDMATRMLADVSGWAGYNKILKENGDSLPDNVKRLHQAARLKIKGFLSIRMIMEAVSAAVGVDFLEDLEEVEQRLDLAVQVYNDHTQPPEQLGKEKHLFSGPAHYLGLPKLKALKIGKLKPTAQSVQYYKERMAISLGEGWYETAIKTVEYETDEGSLAEEVATDLTILNALDEHKKRGGHHGRDK